MARKGTMVTRVVILFNHISIVTVSLDGRWFVISNVPKVSRTGPFFLLMALIALSYGLGILHLGGNGWNLLGLMTLIGAIALWCLPEMLLGKYRQRN